MKQGSIDNEFTNKCGWNFGMEAIRNCMIAGQDNRNYCNGKELDRVIR